MSKLASTLPLTSPKQQDGECYERQAIAFLQAQGLTLIAQNWLKAKVGELDAVMIESGMACELGKCVNAKYLIRVANSNRYDSTPCYNRWQILILFAGLC